MTMKAHDSASVYLRRTALTAKVAKIVAIAVLGLVVVAVALSLVGVGTEYAKAVTLDNSTTTAAHALAPAKRSADSADTAYNEAVSKFIDVFMATPSMQTISGEAALQANPGVQAVALAAATADSDYSDAKSTYKGLVESAALAHSTVSGAWGVTGMVAAVGVIVFAVVAAIAFALSTSAMKARATMPTASRSD